METQYRVHVTPDADEEHFVEGRRCEAYNLPVGGFTRRCRKTIAADAERYCPQHQPNGGYEVRVARLQAGDWSALQYARFEQYDLEFIADALQFTHSALKACAEHYAELPKAAWPAEESKKRVRTAHMLSRRIRAMLELTQCERPVAFQLCPTRWAWEQEPDWVQEQRCHFPDPTRFYMQLSIAHREEFKKTEMEKWLKMRDEGIEEQPQQPVRKKRPPKKQVKRRATL